MKKQKGFGIIEAVVFAAILTFSGLYIADEMPVKDNDAPVVVVP
jgi:hypothetical protein